MGDVIVVAFDPQADAGERFRSPAVRAEIAEVAPKTVGPGEITTSRLDQRAVTADKIDTGAVHAEHIAPGEVSTEHLQSDAVTGPKIADDSVGAEHAAPGVPTAHDADGNPIRLDIVPMSKSDWNAMETHDPNTLYALW